MTQFGGVPQGPQGEGQQSAAESPTEQFPPQVHQQPYPPFGGPAAPGHPYVPQPGWAAPLPGAVAPGTPRRSRRTVVLGAAALLATFGIGYAAGASGSATPGTATVAAADAVAAGTSPTVSSSAAPSSTWTPAPKTTQAAASTTTQAPAPTTTRPPAATTTRAPAPTTTRAPAPAPAPAPGGSVSQENALESAHSYLSFSSFSRSGLVDQLEYEGFSNADATWAVDHVGADWNEQAAKAAQDYLSFTSFSRSGLIDQLEYDGFTASQAEYGASQAGF